MRNKEANITNLNLKKAEKMLFRITIWGVIIPSIVIITLIMLFVK